MSENLSRRDALGRLGAWGIGALVSSPARAASQPVPSGPITPAIVTVSSTVNGVIGPAFAGLSYEKSQMANPFFSPQNSDAIGLFKLIGPNLLRIGGNSVDKTTWVAGGAGRTSGQVAPSDIDALSGFLKACGWQVLYGTNLAHSTPALAADEIAYAVQSLGSSLYGIEIGNEVDLYGDSEDYFNPWNFADYYALWQSFVAAILARSPNVPLTGPVAASNISGYVAPFAKAEGMNVILLSDHYYRANGQLATSTIDLLISPDANIVTQAKAMKAVSQPVDVPYRFAETNSFYNGGSPNVSDSYASALWVIDHLFACASNGAQGINLHGGGDGAGYTPIADSGGVVVGPRPEFYGVALFTLAGQGLVQQTAIAAGGLNATAYAIRAVNGAYSIIINNKDQTQNLNVTIQLPQAAQSVQNQAQLLQLTGPALDATTGVTIQGASIAPTGAFSPAAPTALSTLQCYVAPMSVALVQVAAPSTPPLTIAPGLAAPESIATVYGSGLVAEVSITDSASVTHAAALYYSSPTQINFEIPSGSSLGAAVVSVGNQSAPFQMVPVAPMLYTLNSAGLAAAYAIRVSPNGVQTILAVTSPIDLSSGPVYLILYGTGIRGAGAHVGVTIGGDTALVYYAGPQGATAGLDQINVLIPSQLAGAGTAKIVLTAAGIPANEVEIAIL